jgi:hypothetical protein
MARLRVKNAPWHKASNEFVIKLESFFLANNFYYQPGDFL